MIVVDLSLAAGLAMLAGGALNEVARDRRAGRRSEALCGAFMVVTWGLPACALLAHAAVGA